jgi:hypothetical protein
LTVESEARTCRVLLDMILRKYRRDNTIYSTTITSFNVYLFNRKRFSPSSVPAPIEHTVSPAYTRMWCTDQSFTAFEFFVMQSRATVIHSYLKILIFISYYSRSSFSVFFSFFIRHLSCFISWFLNVSLLHYNALQRLYTIKPAAGSFYPTFLPKERSRLMRSPFSLCVCMSPC